MDNKIIKQWIPLVKKIANKYRAINKHRTYIDWDDIEQVGTLALYKALISFDSNKGTFIQFASALIARAMVRQIRFYKKTENWSEYDTAKKIGYIEDMDSIITEDIEQDKINKKINSISNISNKTKQILTMVMQGIDYTTISKELNIPYMQVAHAVKRHKDKLNGGN